MAIKRRPIRLTNSDHDYILDKNKHIDTIEYDRKMGVDDNYE